MTTKTITITLFAYLVLGLVSYQMVNAEKLIDFRKASIKFSVEKEGRSKDDNLALTIHTKKLSDVDIFDIENPKRIVIDLKGVTTRLNRELPVNNSSLVKALRIGSHPDKLRFVFDVNSSLTPNYTWNKKKQEITVHLNTTKEAKAKQATVPKAAFVPQAAKSVKKPEIKKPAVKKVPKKLVKKKVADPIPVKPKSKIAIARNVPKAKKAVIEKKISIPLQQELQNILFEYLEPDHTPVIKLALSQHTKFSLVKEGQKKYRLTIPACRLGEEHLSLPYFPPHDFEGFAMLQAQQKGQDAQVMINVDRGARISSFARDNSIYLKSITADPQS